MIPDNNPAAGAREDEELLGMDRVTRVTGLGKSWIYDRVNDGSFPKPIKVGRRTLWVHSEVQAWLRSFIAQARNPTGHQTGTGLS